MGIATIIVDQAEEEGWMKNCMFLPYSLCFQATENLSI
jgi:hypothetical protein